MDNSFLLLYDLETLSKAIYSLTSWFPNRRFLGIVDQLNKDLIKNEDLILGSKKIDSYIEFTEFYDKVINNYFQENPGEAFPIDKGNIRFFSDNKFHKVFIGNGSEDTYETLFIIEYLISDYQNLKPTWCEILKYEDLVISILDNYKTKVTDDYKFECPPEEYFEAIYQNYGKFKNENLEKYFKSFKSVNTELYEFFTPQKGYPLFLPLMKECFIEKVEGEIGEKEYEEAVWRSFYRILNSNFSSFRRSKGASFYSIKLIDKDSGSSTSLVNSIAFLSENNLIICVPDVNNLSDEIKEKLKNNDYQIAGLCQDGKIRVFEFKSSSKIEFIGIETDSISPNFSKFNFFNKNENLILNASSVVGIINNAIDIKSIVDFFIKKQQDSDKLISFANMDAYFRVWQSSSQIVNEGALDLNFVLPPYYTVYDNMEFFDKLEGTYPFELEQDYSDIHSWKIVEKDETNLSLVSKSGTSGIDIFCEGNKKIIYKECDLILSDLDIKDLEKLTSFSEIIINSISKNKKIILEKYKRNILEINIISKQFLKEISSENCPLIENLYYSKLFFSKSNISQAIFVSPLWEKILEDNLLKGTLEFENTLLLDILEGSDFFEEDQMVEKIKETDHLGRTSTVFELEIKYYIQPLIKFEVPPFNSFKKVRKSISKIIHKLDLKPGIYSEENILPIIKRFRNEIRDDLILIFSQYDKDILNIKLQNVLSTILFEIDIHHRRLTTLSQKNKLQLEKLEKFQRQTINLREEARVYRPILEYLIEENLLTERQENVLIPPQDVIDELLAYGKYILDFQMLSDAYSYGATNWFDLEIEENFVINISETEQYYKFSNELIKLKYEYGEYTNRDKKIDNRMFEKVCQAFSKDTNIDFEALISFLVLFSDNGTILHLVKKEAIITKGNVVRGKINDFAEFYVERTNLPIESFYSVLSFLILDSKKISINNIIPIWEKKKRENKISAKPIIVNGDKMIFSPASLYFLEKEWVDGVMNFILPYNIGFSNTLNVLSEWKKYYEKKIVGDISSLFKGEVYEIYVDKELYKLDPKGNHPRDLGDYDLFVIDKQRKRILIIEVKYMRLSQTMKDAMGDQKEYFLGKKSKAYKFSRRVEYCQQNLEKLCENMKLEGDYTLEAYFVTNKIIKSNFTSFPFEVLGYNEFKSSIINQKS